MDETSIPEPEPGKNYLHVAEHHQEMMKHDSSTRFVPFLRQAWSMQAHGDTTGT